jgi:hypothetical protein
VAENAYKARNYIGWLEGGLSDFGEVLEDLPWEL